MKKLSVVGLVVMGVVGLLGMSASAKADVQKLDAQEMREVNGGSSFDAVCGKRFTGGPCVLYANGTQCHDVTDPAAGGYKFVLDVRPTSSYAKVCDGTKSGTCTYPSGQLPCIHEEAYAPGMCGMGAGRDKDRDFNIWHNTCR